MTTIDAQIQSVVEEKLEKFNREHTNGYITGDGYIHAAAIVMNPQNGEIYAMAQNPGFDLNEPRKLEKYFTEEELKEIKELENEIEREKEEGQNTTEKKKRLSTMKMNLLNKLWENFCVTYTYEPGSTVNR